jgi:hypothetical protein
VEDAGGQGKQRQARCLEKVGMLFQCRLPTFARMHQKAALLQDAPIKQHMQCSKPHSCLRCAAWLRTASIPNPQDWAYHVLTAACCHQRPKARTHTHTHLFGPPIPLCPYHHACTLLHCCHCTHRRKVEQVSEEAMQIRGTS